MTVYVVMHGDGYENRIYGIFSSNEKAENAIEAEKILHGDDMYYFVENYEVDDKLIGLYYELREHIEELEKCRDIALKLKI